MHVPVAAPEGGLTKDSVVMCDQVRTVSAGRLQRHLGTLDPATMAIVKDRLRIHLDL